MYKWVKTMQRMRDISQLVIYNFMFCDQNVFVSKEIVRNCIIVFLRFFGIGLGYGDVKQFKMLIKIYFFIFLVDMEEMKLKYGK